MARPLDTRSSGRILSTIVNQRNRLHEQLPDSRWSCLWCGWKQFLDKRRFLPAFEKRGVILYVEPVYTEQDRRFIAESVCHRTKFDNLDEAEQCGPGKYQCQRLVLSRT